jgi:hypothetical protein
LLVELTRCQKGAPYPCNYGAKTASLFDLQLSVPDQQLKVLGA